jgi:hypothetical protein
VDARSEASDIPQEPDWTAMPSTRLPFLPQVPTPDLAEDLPLSARSSGSGSILEDPEDTAVPMFRRYRMSPPRSPVEGLASLVLALTTRITTRFSPQPPSQRLLPRLNRNRWRPRFLSLRPLAGQRPRSLRSLRRWML